MFSPQQETVKAIWEWGLYKRKKEDRKTVLVQINGKPGDTAAYTVTEAM